MVPTMKREHSIPILLGAVAVLAVGLFAVARRPHAAAADVEVAADDAGAASGSMDEGVATDGPPALQVPPEQAADARASFAEEYGAIRKAKPFDYHLRSLYERYLDKIGANGLIDGITAQNPTCHDEAHDLGKAIYAKLRDVGTSLRTCQNACYSGCMHGVLMGFFADAGGKPLQKGDGADDDHVEFEDVVGKVSTICDDGEMARMYRRGDCAHGVGHALMYLSDYDVAKAVAGCDAFAEYGMRYYCATGAYMEYVTTHDMADATTKPTYFPCDENAYPAACFRYKLPQVLDRDLASGKSPLVVVTACENYEGKVRLGCFHGIGNAAMGMLAKGMVKLGKVCGAGDDADQRVCIEGAMERMAKYHPAIASKTCDTLEDGWRKDLCRVAVARKMYALDRSFDDYQK
jgi:hypothetical protein